MKIKDVSEDMKEGEPVIRNDEIDVVLTRKDIARLGAGASISQQVGDTLVNVRCTDANHTGAVDDMISDLDVFFKSLRTNLKSVTNEK